MNTHTQIFYPNMKKPITTPVTESLKEHHQVWKWWLYSNQTFQGRIFLLFQPKPGTAHEPDSHCRNLSLSQNYCFLPWPWYALNITICAFISCLSPTNLLQATARRGLWWHLIWWGSTGFKMTPVCRVLVFLGRPRLPMLSLNRHQQRRDIFF